MHARIFSIALAASVGCIGCRAALDPGTVADGGDGDEIDGGADHPHDAGSVAPADAGPGCTTTARAASDEELTAAFTDGLFAAFDHETACRGCHIVGAGGGLRWRTDTKANMLADLVANGRVAAGQPAAQTRLALFLDIGDAAAPSGHGSYNETAGISTTYRDDALSLIGLVASGVTEVVCEAAEDAGHSAHDAGDVPDDAGAVDAGAGSGRPPVRLVFLTPPRDLARATCGDAPISIGFVDADGAPTTADTPRTIFVEVPGGSGLTFYSTGACIIGTGGTSFPIEVGAAGLDLYPWSDVAGAWSIRLQTAGCAATDLQELTVE